MEDNKQLIRKKFIAAREFLPPETASAASASIAEYIREIIPEGAAAAGYCAMRGEVDVSGALEQLYARGNNIALPVVSVGKILKFLTWSPESPLIEGKFGVACPQPHLPEIAPAVVIAPMVAFDAGGNRLGYGGGYYDATIKHLRRLNKGLNVIGVAYAMQRVENLPVHDGDQKMDMVVTEQGVIRFK
jgi:5-formyltetrahydrofolate cyclo-ligase